MSITDSGETIQDEKMTTINDTSSEIVQKILTTHATLLTLPNFKPSPEINSLLGSLVPLCCEIHDSQVVSQVWHKNIREREFI